MLTYKKSLTGRALVLQGTDIEIADGLRVIGGRIGASTVEYLSGAALIGCSARRQKALARSLERAGIPCWGASIL